MIRNKIKVCFFVEDGCKQEDDEASAHWEPINFQIYSSLFPELIQEAIDQWLVDNEIGSSVTHEVIFAHVVERDRGGAVVGEHFEPVLHEQQAW